MEKKLWALKVASELEEDLSENQNEVHANWRPASDFSRSLVMPFSCRKTAFEQELLSSLIVTAKVIANVWASYTDSFEKCTLKWLAISTHHIDFDVAQSL